MSKYGLGWVSLGRNMNSALGVDLNWVQIDVLMPNGKDNPWNAICLEKVLPKI